MFKLNVKRYIKTPSIMTLTVLYLLCLSYMLIYSATGDFEDGFRNYKLLIPTTFFFFLFVSYEYFYQIKADKIEEVMYTCAKGGNVARLSGLAVVCSLLALVCVVFLGYMVVISKANGMLSSELFEFWVKCTIVHHLLVYFLAIMAGFATALTKSKIWGYAILMSISCGFSGVWIGPLLTNCVGNESMYRKVDLMNILAKIYNAIPDLYYVYSIEEENVQKVLFWILMVVVVLCVAMNRRYRRLVAIVPFVGMMLCMHLFLQPTSAVSLDGSSQDAWSADTYYYEFGYGMNCKNTMLYQPANFHAEKYVMNLEAKRQLNATVEVYVDNPTLKEYNFTLYHGYKIKRIKDERGKELTFTQDKDFVCVTMDAEVQNHKFVFEYEGYSKAFYSTSQGMFLPGYFAYYPMPGRRQIYIVEMGYTGYNTEGLGYEVDFEVKISSKENVYSNLTTNRVNQWTGRTEGVTLLASPFAEEMMVDETRVVYSTLQYPGTKVDTIKQAVSEVNNRFEKSQSLVGKTVIIPPENNIAVESYGAGKDYLIGTEDTILRDYENYVMYGKLYIPMSEQEQKEIQEELEKLMEGEEIE